MRGPRDSWRLVTEAIEAMESMICTGELYVRVDSEYAEVDVRGTARKNLRAKVQELRDFIEESGEVEKP